LIKAIQQRRPVIILNDQHLSKGKKIDFFGHAAATATAIAEFSYKYEAVIYPMRLIRKDKYYHVVEVEEALHTPADKEKNAAINHILSLLNQRYEAWIREYPDQWFWLHNRWKFAKKAYVT